MHQVAPGALKISFSQLCLDQQASQLEVDFTTIFSAVFQWDSRPESKIRMKPGLDPEQGTESRAVQDARVTKDIHQERIGAVRALQFAARPICFSGKKTRAGVDLGEP